jgi:RNA-binding protein YhbY
LNNVVNKKKGAKILGERVAEIMCAHLAQVLGHTALLYRPAMPPVLDLDELVGEETDE